MASYLREILDFFAKCWVGIKSEYLGSAHSVPRCDPLGGRRGRVQEQIQALRRGGQSQVRGIIL